MSVIIFYLILSLLKYFELKILVCNLSHSFLYLVILIDCETAKQLRTFLQDLANKLKFLVTEWFEMIFCTGSLEKKMYCLKSYSADFIQGFRCLSCQTRVNSPNSLILAE